MRKHPLASCEECPLLDTGAFCPSDGPEKASVVLVGEAPGYNEAKEGRPFVGASGQLLDKILAHSGLNRSEVFVTNTVLCRPPGNANPPAKAIKACSDRLITEIREREPETVVAMGNFASKQLLQSSEGITQLRIGPAKRSRLLPPDVRVIPTFHPAASLYNADSFPDIVADFQKIKQPKVSTSWEAPTFTVWTDVEETNIFLSSLLTTYSPIAIDIEVGIEKDVDFDHPERYQFLAIGMARSSSHADILSEEVLQSPVIRRTLGQLMPHVKWICHNGKFDLAGLSVFGEGTLHFDTMLASYCLDERRGTNSLEYNAIERLGSPSWKHEVGHYLGPDKNYKDIPRNILYRYNAYDVVNTFRLYELFDKQLREQNLLSLHDFMVEASNMLMYVERNGIHVDEEYLEQLSVQYEKHLDDLRASLRQLLEAPDYNPNSPLQVMNAITSNWPKEARRCSVKDTRADTIEGLQQYAALQRNLSLYDFCSKHLEFKRDSKSYGTYIKGTRKRLYQGRVHSTFLLHGTVSGRLSSRNPNLQNVTRGSSLRRLFIPGSNSRVLGQADYRQAEFRVVCTLARDPYLQSIFLDDTRSIHVEVAKQFYGDEFDKDRDKEKYIRAKAVVFGLLYGREAYSLAAEYNISPEEAQEYINQFMSVIPSTVAWRKDVLASLHRGDDLVTPFGRHRRFWLLTNENKHKIYKEAYSFLPQSTATDINIAAGIELSKTGMRDMLRIPVHDAWVFECDEDQQEDVRRHVTKIMQQEAEKYMGDFVPFPVDVEFGRSWGELS